MAAHVGACWGCSSAAETARLVKRLSSASAPGPSPAPGVSAPAALRQGPGRQLRGAPSVHVAQSEPTAMPAANTTNGTTLAATEQGAGGSPAGAGRHTNAEGGPCHHQPPQDAQGLGTRQGHDMVAQAGTPNWRPCPPTPPAPRRRRPAWRRRGPRSRSALWPAPAPPHPAHDEEHDDTGVRFPSVPITCQRAGRGVPPSSSRTLPGRPRLLGRVPCAWHTLNVALSCWRRAQLE